MPVIGTSSPTALATVSLGDWIDETLNLQYRANNRPAQISLGPIGTGLLTMDPTDNTCTLVGTTQRVNVPTIVEIGEELVLVTAQSTDPNPVYTVSRGYAGSPIQTHTVGDPATIAPEWTRHDTRRHILRGIAGPISTMLPNVKTDVITPTVNTYFVPAPDDCILPLSLAFVQTDSQGIVKRWEEITEWEFRSGVDSSVSSSGMLITVPPTLVRGNVTGTQGASQLYLTYQAPYIWSGGDLHPADGSAGEVESLAWRSYAQDLPALYAAAFSLTGREIGRVQVDKVEYFNQEINFRQGVDLKIGMSVWQRFYQRLGECRNLDRSRDPKHRPYRRMRRSSSRSLGF